LTPDENVMLLSERNYPVITEASCCRSFTRQAESSNATIFLLKKDFQEKDAKKKAVLWLGTQH